MDLTSITQRADLLANKTWGFARGDKNGDRWQFSGSLAIVEALAEQPDDIEALLARVRELEAALGWYADERNYSEDTGAAGKFHRIPSTPDQAPGEFAFEPDCGDVARAALAGGEITPGNGPSEK